MPITPEAVRVAQQAPALARQLAHIADMASRVIHYYNLTGVGADVSDLAADTTITGTITKQEMLDAVTLLASIAYYLDEQRGSTASLTALETPPLSASDLVAYVRKLALVS